MYKIIMTIERANDTDDDEKCTKHTDDDTIIKLFKIRIFTRDVVQKNN